MISSFLGSTSKKIRALFDFAAKTPCVLFLDEFDAIAKLRGDSQELAELKRIVNSLIQNLDTLGNQSIVIAATNHHELLDSAIWRRFSYRLALDFPAADLRRKMWVEFSGGLQFTARKIELLVDLSEGFSGSDIHEVCVRLERRRITKHQSPELKDVFQVLENMGIGEGEGRRFLSLLRENLFSPQSCPIVGAGRLGELFVKARPEGLDRLVEIIESNTSDRMMKELSCVETIEPVTPAYRRSGLEARDVLRRSPRGKHGFITRVGLFNFGANSDQPKLVEDFESTCRGRDIRVRRNRGYSPSSFTYEIECRNVEDVEALSRVIGVRSIAPMPLIRTLRPQMFAAKPLPDLPTGDDLTGDFPVVLVVDSGISDQVSGLGSRPRSSSADFNRS